MFRNQADNPSLARAADAAGEWEDRSAPPALSSLTSGLAVARWTERDTLE